MAKNIAAAKARYFKRPADFRKWLEINHETKTELVVGFHERDARRESITWPESVSEALCFGWIDGVRRRIDDESYTTRFTPRKPTSIWTRAKRLAELITCCAEGRALPSLSIARDPLKSRAKSLDG